MYKTMENEKYDNSLIQVCMFLMTHFANECG